MNYKIEIVSFSTEKDSVFWCIPEFTNGQWCNRTHGIAETIEEAAKQASDALKRVRAEDGGKSES